MHGRIHDGEREVSCTIVEEAWQVSETCGVERRSETIAVEALVDIFVDGLYWASSTLSPADLGDYAVGALFSAGVIDAADEVASVAVSLGETAAEARIDVTLQDGPRDQVATGLLYTKGSAARFPRRGVPSAAHSWAHREALGKAFSKDRRNVRGADWEPIDPAAVWNMSRSLLSSQGMHQATGATHAAVFANKGGIPVLMREDVGRHNAVEKLVGAMLKTGTDASEGFVYLSSRCALELIAKCARAGVFVVATVSAPTSAVIEYGKREGLALLAFARDGRFTVYTHPELVKMPGWDAGSLQGGQGEPLVAWA